MFIRINNITIHIYAKDKKEREGKTPVIFLHGFTGSSGEWEPFFEKLHPGFTPVAVDLIGHGNSSSPENISFYTAESIIDQILKVLNSLKFDKVVLVGYSLGGRVALSFAVRFPQKVKKLILESTTAGIEDPREKEKRILSDLQLSEFILEKGIAVFVDYWLSLPLFDSLKKIPEENYKLLKLSKLRNNPVGLANMLKGFGTGEMPDLWNKLNGLNLPVLLISGSLDKKFTALNQKMKKLLPSAKHKIIEGAGHNVHIEKSEDFIILVNQFLSKNRKREKP